MKLKLIFGALVIAGMSLSAAPICVGNCGSDTANGDVTAPPGGGAYSWISTDGGIDHGGAFPFMGSPSNTTGGSTLTTEQFSALSGDEVLFNFNFVTSDGNGFPDYAWAALEDSTGGLVALLYTGQTTPTGDTVPAPGLPGVSPGVVLTPGNVPIHTGSGSLSGSDGAGPGPVWAELGDDSGSCFKAGCGLTGWVSSDYHITADGLYQIAFGVSNENDNNFQTGLAISGLVVAGTPIDTGATPEPSTFVMLGGAMMALGYMAYRRRAAQQ